MVYLIKQKIFQRKIFCFKRAVLKTELGHYSALFCFKTWYVYGTTDFDKKDCLTFNFTNNFFSNNLEINYQINQIPYYQSYSINPLSTNQYLINNKTLNIIHNNGETLYLTMNNHKYILLKKEHITCEYHMIFVEFMLVMHKDNINKYNLIKQKYC